ncbi:Penicillin-binding protein activator LpoA [hydrothermal vent metagenome]|uniref:Penicillin-binding protein activator LpoA n=1 Tax=hydrothermal vent metagenome TaxID=652676 RepID=A0A3B0Y5I4_9ZZZZ
MQPQPYLITMCTCHHSTSSGKFVYRFYLLLLTTLLGVLACTGAPQRPPADTTGAKADIAQALINTGDTLAAAQLYLSEAKTAPENQRAALRLKAADLLAENQHWAQLEPVLDGLDSRALSPDQLGHYHLLAAQLAVAQRRPEQALELLAMVTSPETFDDHGQQYYQLRAEAYSQAGNPLEAARQLNWLDGLLDEPVARLDNQYRLWEQLSDLSSESLQTLKTAAPQDALSGWMELVLITREYRGDRDRWPQELSRWRNRYPHHAAENALLPDLLHQVGQYAAQANQIAILLPLSSRAEASATAIRDGILAAHYSSSPPKPQLRFYDTGGDAQLTWSIYQQAVEEGADFVIGPLLKDSIQQLAQSGFLPVPVLALNHIGNTTNTDENELPFYQFGLAPEDEARQAAERVFADGHQQLVALVPNNAWGERLLNAFAERFASLGGTLLATERFTDKTQDFGQPIQRLFNLQDSKSRRQALQRLFGQKLNFEPRRRQDAEAVFIAAFPHQARQIKPQLRFHGAGDLPVYATSHVYQPGTDATVDRDMDGLMFPDIPWSLDQEGPWFEQRTRLQAIWPKRGQRYQRLFALGFDAYQVTPWLSTLHLPGFARFPGATGILTLGDNKQLHRNLEWAKFNRGVPELLMSTEGQNETSAEPQGHWR